MKKIREHLILYNKIMEAKMKEDQTEDDPQYLELIDQLPKAYRNSYHRLLQWGFQFIVMGNTAKRAREGNIKLRFFEYKNNSFVLFELAKRLKS